MSPKWRTLLLIGLVAYLIFLVGGVPAAQIDAWTQSDDRKFRLEGLSGTLWAGHADSLKHPAYSVTKIRWRVVPSSLLLGRLEFKFKFNDGANKSEMRLGKDLFGRVHLGKGAVQIDAKRLERLITVVPVGLSGQMQLELNDGLISSDERWLDGTLIWRQAAISAQSDTAPLGDLQLAMTDKDGGMFGALTDLEDKGPFDVDATLSVAADGSYSIDGTVLPRGALQPTVRSVLEFMGPVDQAGKYRINFSGTM